MALINLVELLAAMPQNARLLGLDPGAKRIGVALSDVTRRVASPYGVLARGRLKTNAAEITAIAVREGAAGLVVGMALDEAQMLGPAAQAARDWAHAISAATGLPAAMQDESLTTADARETLIDTGIGRARRDAAIDRLAAENILQAALDAGHKKTAANCFAAVSKIEKKLTSP